MKVRLIALAVLVSVAGCEENSEDGFVLSEEEEAEAETGSDSFSVTGANGLNPGLKGHLITSYNHQPAEIDLATGKLRELPVTTIQDGRVEGFSYGGDVFFSANATGGYVQMLQSCYKWSITDWNEGISDRTEDDSCIAVYGSDLQQKLMLRTTDILITGPAIVSPSGKYVAFNESEYNNDYSGSTITLMNTATHAFFEVYNIPFDEDYEYRRFANDRSPLAWGPNDELYYTVPADRKVTIYITKPGSLAIARVIDLPERFDKEARQLDVSPDGKKLLIGYSGAGADSILLLDLETLLISHPILDVKGASAIPADNSDFGSLLNPRWSPDGKWITAFSRGVSAGVVGLGNANVVAYPDTLYATPANETRTIVNGNGPTNAITIVFEHPTLGRSVIFPGDDYYFNWTP